MRPTLFQRLMKGRLFKFCLVGLSSTIIDKAVFYLLMAFVPILPWFISQSISFIFGVTNGYIWNRKWTFASTAHESMSSQYPKFVATNVIGLILNLLITKAFLVMFTGQLKHDATADRNIILISSLCAVPLVVIWNFSASRLWTFKPASSKPSGSAPIAPPR